MFVFHIYTVKAQYKNKPDLGKGACCSYELAELGLLGPLSRGKNKGSLRKKHNCLAREQAVVKHPFVLTFGTALQSAKGLCSYLHVLVAVHPIPWLRNQYVLTRALEFLKFKEVFTVIGRTFRHDF